MTLGKFIPTISTTTVSDAAIAQSIQPQNPQPQVPQGDYTTSIVLSVVSAMGVIGIALSQIITKAGGSAVDNRASKLKQELEQDSAINSGYVRQADKSFLTMTTLLDTTIGNILQTSRESKEIFYIGHELTKENTRAIDRLQVIVEKNNSEIQTLLKLQKDIMNVLEMRRGEK